MKKLLLALPTLLLMMAGCEKDVDPTAADILVNGAWKLQATGIDANANNVLDQNEGLPTTGCEATATYTYQSTGLLVVQPHGKDCDPEGTAQETFNWKLASNDKALIWEMPGASFTINYRIMELSDQMLILGLPYGNQLYLALFVR